MQTSVGSTKSRKFLAWGLVRLGFKGIEARLNGCLKKVPTVDVSKAWSLRDFYIAAGLGFRV